MHLGQVGVRKGLLHSDALLRAELQHLLHQVDGEVARIREHHPEWTPLPAHTQ